LYAFDTVVRDTPIWAATAARVGGCAVRAAI
jgi:hypothetical protein